ncbi:MAG TPA: tetratricopeptide repeat protein, partial [Ktedonobacterales bacterium]|nr:tetratricopeptide repeat protein [Ktedonobacterales bacterium]
NVGLIALLAGRDNEAERALDESLALGRALANPIRISSALQNLGMLARRRGDVARAEACFSESLALAREMGLLWLQSETLSEWGELALQQGEIARAGTMFGEALDLAEQIKAAELLGMAHFGLARVLDRRGERAAALRHASQSWQIFVEERHRRTAEVEGWLRTYKALDK